MAEDEGRFGRVSRRPNDLAHSALCRYGDDEPVSGACVHHLCEILCGDASRSSWVASVKRAQDPGKYATDCSACLQSRAESRGTCMGRSARKTPGESRSCLSR